MQVMLCAQPVETFLMAAAFLLIRKAFVWLYSWIMHWKVAALIAEWHDAGVKKKMKAKGWRPRRTPLLPRLLAFPAVWMVLSAVMLPATAAHLLIPFVHHPTPGLKLLLESGALYPLLVGPVCP